MIFRTLTLNEDGVIKAEAQGHASDVVTDFHAVASLLLSARGPWRITEVHGLSPVESELDSDMRWSLVAISKDRGL